MKVNFIELNRNEPVIQAILYSRIFPEETDRLALLLSQTGVEQLCNRKSLPGHATASGLVIRNNQILMIHHPFLECWLPPGGHLEAGESPLQAAKREVFEEAGLQTVEHHWHEQHRIPFDIDIHRIPKNLSKGESEHLHYDFRFLLNLCAESKQAEQGEHKHQWFDLNEMRNSAWTAITDKLNKRNIINH